MTIIKNQYTSAFEKASGNYRLDIALAGCDSISDEITVNDSDITINKTLVAGSAVISFDLPSVPQNHRGDTDGATLTELILVDEYTAANVAIVNGSILRADDDYFTASPGAGALLFFEDSVVASASGYGTAGSLNAPEYTFIGEDADDYAALTATRYYMLHCNYEYLTDTDNLVTLTTAALTDSAGLEVDLTMEDLVQDKFIITVIVTGPAQPIVSVTPLASVGWLELNAVQRQRLVSLLQNAMVTEAWLINGEVIPMTLVTAINMGGDIAAHYDEGAIYFKQGNVQYVLTSTDAVTDTFDDLESFMNLIARNISITNATADQAARVAKLIAHMDLGKPGYHGRDMLRETFEFGIASDIMYLIEHEGTLQLYEDYMTINGTEKYGVRFTTEDSLIKPIDFFIYTDDGLTKSAILTELADSRYTPDE